MQDRNRDADMESRLVDTVGEGEGGTNREESVETYTLTCVNRKLLGSGCIAQKTQKGMGLG